MIIYLAIIIPIIAIIFLYIVRKQEIVWWEPLLLIGSCAVFIFISKLLVDYSSIKTKEYWGSFVTRIEYYEMNTFIKPVLLRVVVILKEKTV